MLVWECCEIIIIFLLCKLHYYFYLFIYWLIVGIIKTFIGIEISLLVKI